MTETNLDAVMAAESMTADEWFGDKKPSKPSLPPATIDSVKPIDYKDAIGVLKPYA